MASVSLEALSADQYCTCASLNRDGKETKCLTPKLTNEVDDVLLSVVHRTHTENENRQVNS